MTPPAESAPGSYRNRLELQPESQRIYHLVPPSTLLQSAASARSACAILAASRASPSAGIGCTRQGYGTAFEIQPRPHSPSLRKPSAFDALLPGKPILQR